MQPTGRCTTLPLVFLVIGVAGCGDGSGVDRIDDEWLVRADRDTANWVMHGRTYEEQRFSPLRQINDDNVQQLGLTWSRELGTARGLEATPLVERSRISGMPQQTSTASLTRSFAGEHGKRSACRLLATCSRKIKLERSRRTFSIAPVKRWPAGRRAP